VKRFGLAATLAGTLLSCAGAQVREAAPGDILRQSAATYRTLETYVSEGTATAELEFGESRMTVETAFTMRLAKPNSYLITWSQKNPLVPGMEQRGAVWSDGAQPHLYLGALNAYARMSGDCIALAGAAGVSGGAALTVPSLFLPPCSGVPDVFTRMTDPVLEGKEMVGDAECFVVSSPTAASRKETLWVSARDHLIRKYRRSLEPPEGVPAAPSADAQRMQALPMKGATTEVHGAVGTLMTNLGVELALRTRGVPLVRAKVGDRYVLEELNARGWLLGGEGSGHLLALDKHTTGDGIVSALQIFKAMRRSGRSLADLLGGVALFPQTLINVRLSAGADWRTNPRLDAEHKCVRAELGDRGRILIRPSGTEPVVRVMVEAHDAALAQGCAQRLADALRD